MNTDIIAAVREKLIQNADEGTISSFQNFFKEQVIFHGVKTSIVDKIATEYLKEIKHLGKKEVFVLCEELLKSDYGEEAVVAFRWAYGMREEYEPGDIHVFEHWIGEYVNSWAKCDELCNHSVGTLVDIYPELVSSLKEWAKSDNRWFRRASAVTLILPARNGRFLEDVFEIADTLLTDEDDLVRKGYGWMLKEASKLHQQEVLDYIIRHKAVMPRVALRYAIEKMPDDMRRLAMSKD